MNQGVKTIIYPAKDMAKAKKLYSTLLGTEPHADYPQYIGFKVGDQEIGLTPMGHDEGPISYYHVDNIKASIESLVEAGAQVHQDPRDVGGGRLVATVKDTEGSTIGLIQDPQ